MKTKVIYKEGDIFYYYTGDLLMLEKGHLCRMSKEEEWKPWVAGGLINDLVAGALLIHLPY